MGSSFIGLFFLLTIIPASFASVSTGQPPMTEALAYASGALFERKVLTDGSPCNEEFRWAAEDIVFHTEENLEGSAELATTLKTKFRDLMRQNSAKNLCIKSCWCDDGVCRKRAVIQGYSKIDTEQTAYNNWAYSSSESGTEANVGAGRLTAIPCFILTLVICEIINLF